MKINENHYYPIPKYNGFAINKNGLIKDISTGEYIPKYIINDYLYVKMGSIDVKVIDLVASTFIGIPLPGFIAEYIDGDPYNTSTSNVEYPIYTMGYNGLDLMINGNVFKPWPKDQTYLVSRNGLVFPMKQRQSILKIGHDKEGYCKIRLQSNIDRHKFTVIIHRMVYETWIGPIPDGLQIDHLSGFKWDNDYTNLEIVDQLTNIRRANLNGLRKGLIRWSLNDIRVFCQCMENNQNARDAAKILGIDDPDTICKIQTAFKEIRYGLRFKDIASEYSISNYDPKFHQKVAVTKVMNEYNAQRLSKA